MQQLHKNIMHISVAAQCDYLCKSTTLVIGSEEEMDER